MSDLISRQDAIDALCEDYCFGHHDCKRYPKCENLKAIQKLPSADRPTGEWIIEDAHTEHCSVCGYAFYISALFAVGGNDEPNYCPNCGARMYKGGEDK